VISGESSHRLAVEAHKQKRKKRNSKACLANPEKVKGFTEKEVSKPLIDRFYQVKRKREYSKKEVQDFFDKRRTQAYLGFGRFLHLCFSS
jgi:hypothetical protein